MNTLAFKTRVQELLQTYPNERILSFYFQDKKYWLKQPEKLTGIEKLLKPRPKKAFQRELQRLQQLTKLKAPIPPLILWGDNFFVLEDAGLSLKNLLDLHYQNQDLSLRILRDAVYGLINLHQHNIIHGRPAIRDMLWQDGMIHFIDFENRPKTKDLIWQKARDGLIFIHSLDRMDTLTEEQISYIIQEFQTQCDPIIWQSMLDWIRKYHWLYYVLYLFKHFAHTDLMAIYRLFQQFDKIINK